MLAPTPLQFIKLFEVQPPNKLEDRKQDMKVTVSLWVIIYLFYLFLSEKALSVQQGCRLRKWDERLPDIRQLPWGIQEIDNQWWYREYEHQANLTILSVTLSYVQLFMDFDWIGWYSINNPQGIFIKALTNGLKSGSS